MHIVSQLVEISLHIANACSALGLGATMFENIFRFARAGLMSFTDLTIVDVVAAANNHDEPRRRRSEKGRRRILV